MYDINMDEKNEEHNTCFMLEDKCFQKFHVESLKNSQYLN